MSTEPTLIQLAPESIDAIARRVVELQAVRAPAPVLTVREAMEFVGKGSTSALQRWVVKFAPNARCGDGRYTRAALAKGRELEARKIAPKRPRRTKVEEAA